MADAELFQPDRTPITADIQGLLKAVAREPDTKSFEDIMGRIRKTGEEAQKDYSAFEKKQEAQIAEGRKLVGDKMSALEPVDVKPWTEKPPEADPIREFGSLGFVFAQIASAFTNTPMTNALNGAAAAMRATREADLAKYTEAYNVWKENTNLALERHEAQYQDYTAARDLMNSDVDAGSAAMRTLAAKYGDKYTAALQEAGLVGDLDAMWRARQTSAVSLAQVFPNLEKAAAQQMGYLADPDAKSEDPTKRQQAFQRWYGYQGAATYNPKTVALQAFLSENPGASAESIAKFVTGLEAPRGVGTWSKDKLRIFENWRSEFIAKNGREPTSQEEIVKRQEIDKGGLTGNQSDKLKVFVDQLDNSMDAIDEAMKHLDTHVMAAGVPGRALRLKETVGDLFGGDTTARNDFERRIQYLRLAASRLLTESQGRPLAAEASRINDIVAGLSFSDTTATTLSALTIVQDLYLKMRRNTMSRLESTWDPDADKSAVPSVEKRGAWEEAPEVNGGR